MRRLVIAILLVLSLCYAKNSEAQTIQYVYSGVTHNISTISTSCGDFQSSCNIIGAGAQYHQISWNVSGTLSACSVRIDSSADGVTWNTGDIIAAQTCTSNGNVLSSVHTVNYVRINVTSITPVSTATLTVNLTGYANNPSGSSGGTVTSLTATAPIVATPSTITTTGAYSCPTCAIGPGASTANHVAEFSGTDGVTLKDGGTAGTGTVTNTGGNLTANSVVLGAGTNDTKVATGIVTIGTNNSELDLGVSGTSGILGLNGSTSGKATITAPAIAGTVTNPIASTNAIQLPSIAGGGVPSIQGASGSGINLTTANAVDLVTSTSTVQLHASASFITVTPPLCDAATGTGCFTFASNLITTSGSGTPLLRGVNGVQAGVAGTTTGVFTLAGGTSGTATLTGPAVAGTTTNPIIASNAIQLPAGALLTPALTIGGTTDGIYQFGTHQIGIGSNNFLAINFNGSDGVNFNAADIIGWCSSGGTCTDGDTTLSRSAAGVVAAGTSASTPLNGAFKALGYTTTTNCAGVGTPASPSVVTCTSAAAGAFSCDVAASAATCTINTTAVGTNSEIIVQEVADEGARLSVTCNTAPSVTPAILLATKTNGTGFTINMPTITTNPACFDYWIINK